VSKEGVNAINDEIRYTNWTALRLSAPTDNSQQAEEEMRSFSAMLAENDIELRGSYDLRGLRGDADLLLWLHAPKAESIQLAEFNRSHVPGFMLGKPAKDWLCFYPFVRSFDWYLLPDQERREMLMDHGIAGGKYPGIVANTVASFGLGDYEWLLALESDDLHEIVDMMRALRYTKARLHVREEVPFYTGKRFELESIGSLFA
jgi:chlorite dismutase